MITIYQIKCKKNGKVYIGQTDDINRRWKRHRYYWQKGTHANKKLQSDYDKWGASSFEFSILHKVNDADKWEAEFNSIAQIPKSKRYNVIQNPGKTLSEGNPKNAANRIRQLRSKFSGENALEQFRQRRSNNTP